MIYFIIFLKALIIKFSNYNKSCISQDYHFKIDYKSKKTLKNLEFSEINLGSDAIFESLSAV
jgi:hypothetical protein